MSLSTPNGAPPEKNYAEDPLYHYTRVFIRFYQEVFAAFEKGDYQWLSDEKLTDIIISDQAVSGRDAVEKRPALVIARGTVSYGNLSFDQMSGPVMQTGEASSLTPSTNPKTGLHRHTDLNSGSVSVTCISSKAAEAQLLAHRVAMSTRRLKRTLMKMGIFRVGEDLQIGAESAPGAMGGGDPEEMYGVTVIIPFFWQDFWSVEPVDKNLLKSLQAIVPSNSTQTLVLNTVPERERYRVLGNITSKHGIHAKDPKPK